MAKIVVIGGGPGGYVAAIRAAQLGAEVTLVEKEHMGGTCLNVGCIPTKALLHAAELYEEVREGASCGVIAEAKVDFTKTQAYKAGVVNKLVSGIEGLMKVNKVQVIYGTASFTGPKTLSVNGKDGKTELSPDKIIIATGSIPAKPPIPGIDSPQCIDSTGALSLEAVPERMIIIGGGVIGVEMCTAYTSLGCKVTIVEMLEEILPPMDRELTGILRKKLEKKGVQILTGAKVLSLESKGSLGAVTIEDRGEKKILEAEKILVCVGRRTNTADLNLDAAGIKNDRGKIQVDAGQRTNVDGVYAIGDCTGGAMLAHIASAQGEIAAENAMGHAASWDPKTNPACVYTNPEFAGVGLNEEQAKAKGVDYIVGKFPLMANGKTLIMGGDGVVKIIAGKKYHEVLGVHMVGPRATDLITEGALAIRVEATVDELISTIHAHPTVGEAIREAALAVEGRAIHIPNR
jgi:dihydrolipoamide dehydrogenase